MEVIVRKVHEINVKSRVVLSKKGQKEKQRKTKKKR